MNDSSNTIPSQLSSSQLKTLIRRYVALSALVMITCVHIGLVVWTLVRFTQIEHWSPGIQFFGNEMIQTKGLTKSAVSNLQEGTWFHLVRIRNDGGITVTQVDAGSPADKAGLRSGDVVISIDGTNLGTRPEAYFQARLRSNPGDRFNLAWLRDGRMHSGILTLEATEQVRYAVEVNQEELVLGVGAMTWFQRGPYLIYPMVLLVFGTWMGFRSPHSPLAFPCALLFLAMALSSSPAFHPMMAGWPDWVLSLSIFVIVAAYFLEIVLMFRILAVFPGTTAFGSWLIKRSWFILTPLVLWLSCRLIYLLSLTYGWDHAGVDIITEIVEPVPVPALPILVVITAGCLLITQRSVARHQQRTRLHIIKAGFISALILAPLWTITQPGTLLASWDLIPIGGPALPVLVWLFDRIVHAGLQCGLPLAFVYTILAHRVFGLNFVFGRGLRYLANARSIYLILCFWTLIALFELISVWPNGMDTSDLLIASAAAGFTLILVGGWTWVKTPVIRLLNQYLLRDEYENRQRLFILEQSLTQYQDRNALLSATGQELLEGLDVCNLAIYLAEGPRETLSVRWYGVREKPEQDLTRNESFFTEAAGKVEGLLRSIPPEQSLVEYRELYANENMKDTGCELIVMIGRGSDRQGCIALGAKLSEEPFNSDEKEQLVVLSAELELALKNLDMATSLRHQAQGLQRLSRRLIDVQESERRRLARDLHDDTGQALTALKMSLEITRNELSGASDHTAERLSDAVALADDTLEKLRTISHSLRPPTLDAIGLNASLDRLCQNFAHRTGIAIAYNGTEGPNISNMIDICLYRILQEGLTNCAKHGGATRIKVDLERNGQAIQLSICDNGRGFDPRSILMNQDGNGIGLIDMRERVESLEGHLAIYSQPGSGTRLVATIPLEEK